MKNLNRYWADRLNWFSSDGREKRIRDYLTLANSLVWQRQASFFAAAALAAFYFDPISVFSCYAVVVLTEMLDQILSRRADAWDGQDPVVGRKILTRIFLNTIVSALAISVFIINIAVQQTAGGHFTPLFFLFSASVFAAMYNSQLIGVLLVRLSIYGFAFLYIALLDVIRYSPPLSSPIWLEFFTIIFVLYFIVDISVNFYLGYQDRLNQMKLIEEENERTKAALEIKTQFLSTVSHELRTPLTSIIGSLELVNNGVLGELPDKAKPVLGIAARNGRQLANLINDLLDLQKMETGEISFQLTPIEANDLVQEAVDSNTGYADKLGISVSFEPFGKDCRIMGERNRLLQVMNNLLSNALKFSDEGGTVRVRVEDLDGRVRISVQDSGVGIPEGAEERVFGKFSQVDSSDVRRVGGTGLGLNITKEIVERHGATINYDSELGVGTTFYLEFDHLPEEEVADDTTEPVAQVA